MPVCRSGRVFVLFGSVACPRPGMLRLRGCLKRATVESVFAAVRTPYGVTPTISRLVVVDILYLGRVVPAKNDGWDLNSMGNTSNGRLVR